MGDRKGCYRLHGAVQIDDPYLGGERTGSKAGSGSENKVPFIAVVSLNADEQPLPVKVTPWSGVHLPSPVGLVVATLGAGLYRVLRWSGLLQRRHHYGLHAQPTSFGGRKQKDLPEFQGISTVLGNLKTSLSGVGHVFAFSKYAAGYLAAFAYRFNRRFDMATLPQRLLIAVVHCRRHQENEFRLAELSC